MAANTVMMYFKVEPASLKLEDVCEKLQNVGHIAVGPLSNAPVTIKMAGDAENGKSKEDSHITIFHGKDNSHAIMRVYHTGLVTLDIQHYITDANNSPYNINDIGAKKIFNMRCNRVSLSEPYIMALEKRLKQHLGNICLEFQSLQAPVQRGTACWPYVTLSDERLVEMDYDRVVFHKRSPWQDIKIVHSAQNGNVLLLDRDLMIGEKDLVYTQTLCCIGEEDYTGKTVLVLGGGDGGILCELLKEQPAFITMAEIDEDVIDACRKHLRGVCGSALDQLEGPNHRVVIEDCVKLLHESIESGQQYDIVINDLTEIPLEDAVKAYNYNFETSSLITEMSLKALKPGGKLFARGHCRSATVYRNKFESDLHKLGCKYKCKEVYVPSFAENYCLYEIWEV